MTESLDLATAARIDFHKSIVRGVDTEQMVGSSADLKSFFTLTFEDGATFSPPLPILTWGVEQIQRYQNEADSESHPMIWRKINHTRHVMEKILQISRETEEDWNESQLLSIAFLHDICRFPQAFHYKTFKDGESFDHADMAAEMIVRAHLPFAAVDCVESEVLNAVADHSKLETPMERYSQIIRDADKMVIVEEFMNDNAKTLEKGIEAEEIDLDALNQLLSGRVIKNSKKTSRPANRTLQRISWMHDLNYSATEKIAKDEYIFDRLYTQLIHLTNDPLLFQVKEHIELWKSQSYQVTSSLPFLYPADLDHYKSLALSPQ